MFNKCLRWFFILGSIGISLGLSGCGPEQSQPNTTPPFDLPDKLTIDMIMANPQEFIGKTVVLEGKFGGWGGELSCDYSNLAMKTKSDTILYDDTGCIYMTGELKILSQEKNLDPSDPSNIGSSLKVEGVVSLIDGKPILGQ